MRKEPHVPKFLSLERAPGCGCGRTGRWVGGASLSPWLPGPREFPSHSISEQIFTEFLQGASGVWDTDRRRIYSLVRPDPIGGRWAGTRPVQHVRQVEIVPKKRKEKRIQQRTGRDREVEGAF